MRYLQFVCVNENITHFIEETKRFSIDLRTKLQDQAEPRLCPHIVILFQIE